MSVKETLIEDKMRIFEGECADFSFNKCPIYTRDGASAKFSTNSQDTDNSADSSDLWKVRQVLYGDGKKGLRIRHIFFFY